MPALKNGTFLGDYAIIRLIARGGMGEVYEAYDAKLDRRVALKVISADKKGGQDAEELVRRFMQEGRTLAKVNHPNVVTIHAIHNASDAQFIAMEYIEGVSLKEYLEHHSLPIEIALALFEQILKGLQQLHQHNVVHRDLKPSNILIRSDGQIKILDFGIAKAVDGRVNTKPGVAVGTPPYMAPELRDFKSASFRSDFWSLGAIFFECLTRKLLVTFLEGDEFKFKKEDLRLVPAELRAIIGGMCAPEAGDRYRSAGEILEDLRRFREQVGPPSPPAFLLFQEQVKQLAGEPSPAPLLEGSNENTLPSLESGKPRRFFSRKRSFAGLTVAVTAAVVVGYVAWFGRSNPRLGTSPAVWERSAVPEVPRVEPLRLLEPSEGQSIQIGDGQNPVFRWSRPLAPGDYDLQIALDSEFRKIVFSRAAVGSSLAPSHKLRNGTYYWRLSSRRTGAVAPIARTFSLARVEPVDLVRPAGDQILEAGALEFEWSCSGSASRFEIQVAPDAGFKSPVAAKSTGECKLGGLKLPAGRYFWRVRAAADGGARSNWSQARAIVVRSPPEKPKMPPPRIERTVNLASPVLMAPMKKVEMRLTSKRRPASTGVENEIELKWKAVKGARRYRVQIASTRDFARLEVDREVKVPRFRWNLSRPGTKYWRVRALSASGALGKPSAAGSVVARLPAPVLKSEFNFSPSNGAPVVRWTSVPLAPAYLVQMGPKRDLASAREKIAVDPRLELPPTAGRYYLRVAAVDESAHPISAFSKVAVVNVAQSGPSGLGVPVPASPVSGARAPSKNGRISVEFKWTSVPGATGYSIEVANDPGFKNVVRRSDPGYPTVLFEQAEFRGRVYWRVRARSAGRTSGWSRTFYFDVK